MTTLSLPPSLVPSLCNGCYQDDWTWDNSSKSPDVTLSRNRKAAYFHIDPIKESTGTAGVRGTSGFTDGEHYWEVKFLEAPLGTSVMVGVGTEKACLHVGDYQYVNLLGKDDQSWGVSYKGTAWHGGQKQKYCEPFYYEGTVIGVHLNLHEGTLTFYKDGQNLGVAFHGLNKVSGKLYPMISSTATLTEMEVGGQFSRRASLQEKCYLTVVRNLKRKADAGTLPLPPQMKRQLIHSTEAMCRHRL